MYEATDCWNCWWVRKERKTSPSSFEAISYMLHRPWRLLLADHYLTRSRTHRETSSVDGGQESKQSPKTLLEILHLRHGPANGEARRGQRVDARRRSRPFQPRPTKIAACQPYQLYTCNALGLDDWNNPATDMRIPNCAGYSHHSSLGVSFNP